MSNAQRQVLKMLEAGTITAEDANRLLAALGSEEAAAPAPPPNVPDAPPFEPDAVKPDTVEPDGVVQAAASAAAAADIAALAAGSVEEVLRDVQRGKLSAEEAGVLLSEDEKPKREAGPVADWTEEAVPEAADLAEADAAWTVESPNAELPDVDPPAADRVRAFWQVPLLVGGGLLAVSILCMASSYDVGTLTSRLSFLCGWSVFMLAALTVGIAWWSRRARWLHLRIAEHNGQRFTLSLPVPLRMAGWLLGLIQPFVKGEAQTHLATAADFLRELDTERRPPAATR